MRRRSLLQRAHGTRCERDTIWSPEQKGHKFPIDLACWIDGCLIAFEHTSIQAFENQVKLSIDAADFFKPIEKTLSNVLPHSEQYVLYVPVTATQGLKGLKPRKIKQTQNAIINWISEVAPTPAVSSWPGVLIWQSAEVPFPMSLCSAGK